MVICAAFGCSSRSGRDKLSFFTFPKDKQMRSVWVSKIGRGCTNNKTKAYVPNANSRLCALHFEDDCFVRTDAILQSIGFTGKFKKRLKSDAVPTIFQHRKERTRRLSSEAHLEKRRKLQFLKTVTGSSGVKNVTESFGVAGSTSEHSGQPLGENNLNDTVALHPVDSPDQFPSGLETLACVACFAEPIDKTFHIQCQTPQWKNPSKEVQVGTSSYVTCGTQTDWENDVKQKVKIHLPNISLSSQDSFQSDLEESRTEETCDSDITWEPSDAEMHDLDATTESNSSQGMERKFIVYESNLDRLLNKCAKCSNYVTVVKSVRGSLLTCSQECHFCNETDIWTSQPCSGSMAMGHLEMSAAIMFSGNGPTKFLRALRFAGIATFSEATFFNIQSAYLAPGVLQVWENHQSHLIESVRAKGAPLKLGGDGRCCSPGHTAKYGTYSVMDLESGKIIDIQLVQSNEVKNSYGMELEGLQRSLEFLVKENGLEISHLVTDRHSAVKKYMKDQHPDIIHWFDVWHVAKGVYKKLEAAGKKKGCEKVKAWARSVSNHMYWAAASSNGDGELVVQKWLSILNHVANIHEGHGDRFPKCEHDELEERLWMKKGYKPHAELSKVVENKVLLKDIQKLSPAQQTSSLEAFHKVMCGWVPKSTHYMHSYMESRTKVSALHFNENAGRAINVTKTGVIQYSVSYPKGRQGQPVVKEVKTEQTFGYVTELMECVKQLRQQHNSYRVAKDRAEDEITRPLPLAQSTPRRKNLSKEELIRAHVSRFNN